MGEARRPEGLAQLGRHRHHRTAQHQGRQHPAALGACLPHQGLGHATAQIGHRRGGLLQHIEVLHLQLAEGALASQPFGGGCQQWMG